MKSSLILLPFMSFALAACAPSAPSAKDDLEQKDKRIADLERQLGSEQKKRSDEETLRSELEKHQSRMLSCHRDFRGSYGTLIQKSTHLVRETARVQRFDCRGQMIRDENETIKAPRADIELGELKILASTTATIQVMNRQTCRGGGLHRPLTRWGTPALWVDRGNAVLTHEVFAGLNQIDFGLCDASGKTENVSKDCANPTWVATLELKVTEEEKRDSKIHEKRPSTEDCAKQSPNKNQR